MSAGNAGSGGNGDVSRSLTTLKEWRRHVDGRLSDHENRLRRHNDGLHEVRAKAGKVGAYVAGASAMGALIGGILVWVLESFIL